MQSLISPESIVKNRQASPSSFYNFMTGGGASTAASSVGSAANKIVKFSGGNIKPNAPNASSLINNISTNVNNFETQNITRNIVQNNNRNFTNVVSGLSSQYQGTIGKIQNQVQSTLNNLIQSFTKDYQKRIQDSDARKPSNILRNFLGLYQNAVNLVSFFGDEKNHRRISNSLKSLRRIFNESFEVAILVRQTISKIVKQLSNLPTASGRAPDLNLDVKVPGDRLKQSGGRSIGQFSRSRFGRAVGFTAAGAGIAALGAGTATYGMSRARQFQEEELRSKARGVEQSQTVPESFLDSLENIISRFTNAVEKLVGAGQQTTARSASSSGAAPPPPQPGEQNTGTSTLEGMSPPVNVPVNQEMASIAGGAENYGIFKESIASIESSAGIYDIQGGSNNSFFGRYQMGTNEIASAARRANVPVPTTEEFKKNPQLQEQLMQQYTIMNHLTLMSTSPRYKEMNPKQRLAVLAYAHNAGAGGAAQWLSSGRESIDGFGTPALEFYKRVSENLSNPTVQSRFQSQPQSLVSPSVSSQIPAPILPPPPTGNIPSRPTSAQATPNISYLQLPPNILTSPSQSAPSQASSPSPSITPSGSTAGPDVSMLMETSNSENPYIFLPFSLGIIA